MKFNETKEPTKENKWTQNLNKANESFTFQCLVHKESEDKYRILFGGEIEKKQEHNKC